MKQNLYITFLVGVVLTSLTTVTLLNSTLLNPIDPLVQLKLNSYANTHFKPVLNYNAILFTGYKQSNGIIVVYITIDGKNVKWLTSQKNYNFITT